MGFYGKLEAGRNFCNLKNLLMPYKTGVFCNLVFLVVFC